jgi:hypothetical protein
VNALAARLGLEASLGGMPCAGLTEPLDQRIESFLADILAVAGEDLDAIARWVRVALADCEEIFRAQETIDCSATMATRTELAEASRLPVV